MDGCHGFGGSIWAHASKGNSYVYNVFNAMPKCITLSMRVCCILLNARSNTIWKMLIRRNIVMSWAMIGDFNDCLFGAKG